MANMAPIQRAQVPYGKQIYVGFSTSLAGAIAKGITWGKHTVQYTKNGSAYANTTYKPVEIGAQGYHYILLTASEVSGFLLNIRMVDGGLSEFDELHLILDSVESGTGAALFEDQTVDLRLTAGTALGSAAAGYLPCDSRRVDGVALGTHASGHYPGDTRRIVSQTIGAATAGYFPADNRRINGSALGTTAAGYMPSDARRVDGVALDTHDSGSFPADVRTIEGGTLAAFVSSLVDDIWDELSTGHTIADSFGKLVDDMESAVRVDIPAQLTTIEGNQGTINSNVTTTINQTTPDNIADAVLDAATADHVAAGTFGLALGTTLQSTLATLATASALSTVDGIVDAILLDTAEIANLNDLSAAAVNAEVDTALSDIGLDHLLSASVAGADVADDSVVAQIVSSSATADWDDYDNTTDSLEAIAAGAGGGGPTAGDIADAVLQEAVGDHTGTAGSLAEFIDAILTDTATTIPGTLSTLATASALATVDTVVDGIAVQTAAIEIDTSTTIPAQITSEIDDVQADIAALSIPTAAAIADAVLDEALSGHTTAGTLGKAIADIDTDTTAILEDTATAIPGTLATLATQASVDVVDGIVDQILLDTTAILEDTGTTLPGALAGLATAADLATVDTVVDGIAAQTTAILDDTGIALVSQIDGVETKVDVIDALIDALTIDVTAILDDTSTAIPAQISGLSIPSAAQNADAVLDELLAGHTTSDSVGEALGIIIDTLQTFSNRATVVVEGGGTRLVTIYEIDDVTVKYQVRISADGLTRTRL